ncbi:MAG TPA: thiamine-phosphate kinase [Gemmatimonadales bacterium]|nr:thiamine-phosphate kinase [Gemmatimonadales bacterium]
MSEHQLLGPGPEFDRVRAILAALGERGAPSGDDCALIPIGGQLLAVSTDISVEGVHFKTEWLSFEEIGYRSTAAALSDLAAEGADPHGVLVALGCPRTATDAEAAAVMKGAGLAAEAAGTVVVGGDLTSATGWTVAVTVLGTAARPVTRAGGKVGDRLYVTGDLGGAKAALDAWLAGRAPDPAARRRFVHPEPRIAAGRVLARTATAMLDLSDGLAADVRHLAAASHCGAEIDLDKVPLGPGVPEARAAAEGGEDYELLVALPPDAAPPLLDVKLTEVGRLVAGDGVAFLQQGARVSLQGFQHFR